MRKEEKELFLLYLLLVKKYHLKERHISVSLDNLLIFLDKYYFEKEKFSKKEILNFAKENNDKIIIDFLWSEAIVNPIVEF